MNSNKKKDAGQLDKNKIRERISGYLLIAPATILLLVFTVYPIGYLFYHSPGRHHCSLAEGKPESQAE